MVPILFVLLARMPADAAVMVTRAELNGTQLRLEGQGAVPNAPITVDGKQLGSADGGGFYRIETSPFSSPTCKVTVSDGQTSATATLSGCTPSPPPPAPPPPPGPVTVTSVTVTPSTVTGGSGATGAVGLSATTANSTTVALSNDAPGVVSMPASVVVPAGSSSASFAIGTSQVSQSTLVHVTASLNNTTASTSFTVAPPNTAQLVIGTAGLTCTHGVCELGPANVATF